MLVLSVAASSPGPVQTCPAVPRLPLAGELRLWCTRLKDNAVQNTCSSCCFDLLKSASQRSSVLTLFPGATAHPSESSPAAPPSASPPSRPSQNTDLFKTTSSGATPFFAACEGGRVDVVRSLMEKATSLGKLEEMCNHQDAAGKTPFDMAAAGQHKVRAMNVEDIRERVC